MFFKSVFHHFGPLCIKGLKPMNYNEALILLVMFLSKNI